MKHDKKGSSDEITVFNYILLFPFAFILLGIIIVAFLLAKSPQNFRYDMLAILILPIIYLLLLFAAPVLIIFKSKELTVKYLLRKKSVNWESVKYIVHEYNYSYLCYDVSKYCVIHTENGKEKRLHLPAFKKNMKLLEQYSKLQVIDQYKYRDIKEKEYKNQFKKK